MYDSFEKERVGLNENQLIDVHYEDLVKDPVSVCKNIYNQLELTGFEKIEPLLQNRIQQEKEYQTNRFGSDPEVDAEIMTTWHSYATKYGYA